MRECEVHQPVFVEVQGDGANRRRWKSRTPRFAWLECTLSWIAENDRSPPLAGDHEIDGAIVVDVGRHDANACGVARESCLRGRIRKGAIAVIAPHLICRCALFKARHIQIEIAVMVVIDERHTERWSGHADAKRHRRVAERALAGISINGDAIGQSDRDIVESVVVVIAGRAAGRMLRHVEARSRSDVSEAAA